MSYISALMQKLSGIGGGGSPLGAPPKPGGAPLGAKPAVPAPQTHIDPAPYDVAHDPSWQGIVDPNDHEFRNFLNNISPEERQMLLKKVMNVFGGPTPAPTASPRPPTPQPAPPPGM